MKTNRNLCRSCQKRFEQYGCLCLEFMEEICRNAVEGNIFCYHEAHSPVHVKTITRHLELKKLLVTCDLQDEWVAIKPNLATGSFDDEKKLFCWCGKGGELP